MLTNETCYGAPLDMCGPGCGGFGCACLNATVHNATNQIVSYSLQCE